MIKVFLDANVLYSNTMRSLFIWLHVNRVVEIYWTMEVWEEVFRGYGRKNDATKTESFRSSLTKNAIAEYPSCMVRLSPFEPIGLKDYNDEPTEFTSI